MDASFSSPFRRRPLCNYVKLGCKEVSSGQWHNHRLLTLFSAVFRNNGLDQSPRCRSQLRDPLRRSRFKEIMDNNSEIIKIGYLLRGLRCATDNEAKSRTNELNSIVAIQRVPAYSVMQIGGLERLLLRIADNGTLPLWRIPSLLIGTGETECNRKK